MGIRGASLGWLVVPCLLPLSATAQPASGGLNKGDVVIGTSSPPTLRAYGHDGAFIGSIDLSDLLPPYTYDPTRIAASVFDRTTGSIYALSQAGRFGTDVEILQVRTRPPFTASISARRRP